MPGLRIHSMDNSRKIRLDKWLWAARFYKTRELAKQAVAGGKVHYNGLRVKAGQTVSIGATVKIRQRIYETIILINALSERRGSATEAGKLYQETEQSQQNRLNLAEQRKLLKQYISHSDKKPDKKQRRQLREFKAKN